MAKFPHLPLWTDAYMADTLHLTHEEHGLYLMLLMTVWRCPDCKIPNDMDWIKRRLRATDEQMETLVKRLIDDFFPLSHGGKRKNRHANAMPLHLHLYL